MALSGLQVLHVAVRKELICDHVVVPMGFLAASIAKKRSPIARTIDEPIISTRLQSPAGRAISWREKLKRQEKK